MVEIDEMTVTNSKGHLKESVPGQDAATTETKNISGECRCVTSNPYAFYAVQTVIDYEDMAKTANTVHLVMPVGGDESGLYRFPRCGEKVLVAKTNTGSYYLMGYVPSITKGASFHPVNPAAFPPDFLKTVDEEAYKPGATPAKVYAKVTALTCPADSTDEACRAEINAVIDKMKAAALAAKNAAEKAAEGKTGAELTEAHEAGARAVAAAARGETDITGNLVGSDGLVLRTKKRGTNASDDAHSEISFYREKTQWPKAGEDNALSECDIPEVDRLNIRSTGDIHQKAQNYQLIQGRRLEILSDCEPTDHSKDGSAEPDLPFGDQVGDDPYLYGGDIHIRGKNRLVLKAGSEIILEVGRSSIVINDQGIGLLSRKTKANVANGFDTSLCLTPLLGITAFGQHLTFRSGVDFVLEDNYGAGVNCSLGLLRMKALDIRAVTMNLKNYTALGVKNIAVNAADMISMISGCASGDKKAITTAIGQFGLVFKGNSVFNALMGVLTKDPSQDQGDLLGSISLIFTILMVVTLIVGMVIEEVMPEETKRAHGRDGLYAAMAMAEYGIESAVWGAITAAALKNPESVIMSTVLNLQASGDMFMGGKGLDMHEMNFIAASAPLAGVSKVNHLTDQWAGAMKILKGLGLGVGAAAALGIAVGVDSHFEKQGRGVTDLVGKYFTKDDALYDELRRL